MLKVIVKFNRSPNLSDVVDLLIQFNDYIVTNQHYQIVVARDEIKQKSYLLLRLFRIIKNWKSVTLFWNEKELTQYHMYSFGMFLLCSIDNKSDFHCYSDGKKSWGCKYINAVLLEESGGWYNYGEFIDKENTIWKINKNDILNTILNQVFVEGIFICPLYREELLYSIVSQLPDIIDLNKNKDYKRVFNIYYDHKREYIENKIIHIDDINDNHPLKSKINSN
jgi:hypothetical protein